MRKTISKCKCDRCGKEIEYEPRRGGILLDTYHTVYGSGWNGTAMMMGLINFFGRKRSLDTKAKKPQPCNLNDLCHECAESLDNTMRDWWVRKDPVSRDARELIADFCREEFARTSNRPPREGEVCDTFCTTVKYFQIDNFLAGRIKDGE